jgi:hypothetical protein
MSRAALLATLLCLLAACANTDQHSDFDRHRYSQLVQPFERPGITYFDVTYTAAWQAGDPAAEEERMRWLAGWLRARGSCAESFEVLLDRPFDWNEDNPRRHDRRYEVRCRGAGSAP